MTDPKRKTAREIANSHLLKGDAKGWFEALYAQAEGEAGIIPWADLAPNPNLTAWMDANEVDGKGQKALKIGCGLGDDAEELALRGFETTAFDISATAVDWCARRFPDSRVNYLAADLFDAPDDWRGAFDLVLESYTLQVLPPAMRTEAMRRIADFVGDGGSLLVIARGREPDEPEGKMPWPLTRAELASFQTHGLREASFEDYEDREDPPVRRFRIRCKRE